MTRQENILTLNEHLEHWKRLLSEKICNQSEGEKTIDALQNAIKALEQEPSYNSIKTELKPCEDAISRQEAIDAITKTSGIRGDTLKALYDLPSVTPHPKMGRWILTSDDDYEYCTCSECGYENGENWMIGSQIKFCQECGANMQEVKDE